MVSLPTLDVKAMTMSKMCMREPAAQLGLESPEGTFFTVRRNYVKCKDLVREEKQNITGYFIGRIKVRVPNLREGNWRKKNIDHGEFFFQVFFYLLTLLLVVHIFSGFFFIFFNFLTQVRQISTYTI